MRCIKKHETADRKKKMTIQMPDTNVGMVSINTLGIHLGIRRFNLKMFSNSFSPKYRSDCFASGSRRPTALSNHISSGPPAIPVWEEALSPLTAVLEHAVCDLTWTIHPKTYHSVVFKFTFTVKVKKKKIKSSDKIILEFIVVKEHI